MYEESAFKNSIVWHADQLVIFKRIRAVELRLASKACEVGLKPMQALHPRQSTVILKISYLKRFDNNQAVRRLTWANDLSAL